MPDPLLLNAVKTAEVLDIARSTLYQWDEQGRIPQPVRIGARIYWRYDELKNWIAAGAPAREKWLTILNDS